MYMGQFLGPVTSPFLKEIQLLPKSLKQSEKHQSLDGTVHESKAPSATSQFGIAALFWITFSFGLGLSYLQQLDRPDVVIGGVVAIALGALFGCVIGLIAKQIWEAMFWATLVAAFGYITTSGDHLYQLSDRLAWAMIGATSGAICGALISKPLWVRVLVCAIVAGLIMGIYPIVFGGKSVDRTIDTFTAPVIGAVVALFIAMIRWVESQREMPRYVTATWLLGVVIIGNLISQYLRQ